MGNMAALGGYFVGALWVRVSLVLCRSSLSLTASMTVFEILLNWQLHLSVNLVVLSSV